jgi:urease alpha subunit
MTQVEHLGADMRVFYGSHARAKQRMRVATWLKAATEKALNGDRQAKSKVAKYKQASSVNAKKMTQKNAAQNANKVPPHHTRVVRNGQSRDLPITQLKLSKVLDWLASPQTKIEPPHNLAPSDLEFLRS